MQKTGALILVISGMFYAAAVSASDFKNGVCGNNEFLRCVGATQKSCEKSYSQAEKDCIKKYPLDTDKEEYNVAKKYGECSSAGFISGLNIEENKFEECGKYLEPTFAEYRKNAERAHKLNKEKIRKLEELHYQ